MNGGRVAQIDFFESISPSYAIAFGIACGWSTLFSMTIKAGVRGFRNFGIFAPYLMIPIMLIQLPLLSAGVTWCVFGIGGGLLYLIYDLIADFSGVREERLGIQWSHILYGQMAWPIMIPEAIENTLTSFGILGSGKMKEPPPSQP